MKNNLEKIFASCSIVVAIILIMILIVTAFGGIAPEEFDSELVQGLLITLAILYVLLSMVSLVLIFVKTDIVKEITLRTEQGGSVRVSAKVITRIVKDTCKQVDGVKCKKVTLVADDYGVRLKVNVKIIDKDVIEAETYLRTLLEDVFMKEFGFKFHSIEIKVMALQSRYQADQAEINAKVEQKLVELKQAQIPDDDDDKLVLEEVAQSVEQEEVAVSEDLPQELHEQVEDVADVEKVEDVENIDADVEDNDNIQADAQEDVALDIENIEE